MRERRHLDIMADDAIKRMNDKSEYHKAYIVIPEIYQEMVDLINRSDVQDKKRQIKRLQFMLGKSHYLIGKESSLNGMLDLTTEDVK